jgi:hypothetical protein
MVSSVEKWSSVSSVFTELGYWCISIETKGYKKEISAFLNQ